MAAETELNLIRAYELRLLRCTLPSPPLNLIETPSQPSDQQTSHPLQRLITDVVSSIEAGHYARALSSDAVRLVFNLNGDDSGKLYDDSVESAELVYSELMKSVESFLTNGSEGNEDGSYKAILVMAIAIASFLAFMQCNITGPCEMLPLCLLPLDVLKGVEWEKWARSQLSSAGSDLLGRFSNLRYIVFAKTLLTRTKELIFERNFTALDGKSSISWWLARLILIQQRILDERSSSLFDPQQCLMGETLNHFGTVESVKSYWGALLHEEEALTILTVLHLEAGMMEHTYGRVDPCRRHFELAEEASGFQLSVTGVLGFRTVHQVEPKAQMVLVAHKNTSNGGDTCPSTSSGVRTSVSSRDRENSTPHQHETSEVSDILLTPRLVETNDSEIKRQGLQKSESGSFKAIQQAVILAQCTLIEKSNPHNEMQGWQMAPYIEAIDSQKPSDVMIRFLCDILRIRWESTRSHTKERALLMMERLVQGVYEPSPDVAQRMHICFGVSVPTIPAMRKEYGELLVSCRLIGEAVKIFEDLELWDNLIYCYCLLEKKAAAVELIKTRLDESPNDPRLWCSLGDTTHNDACYEKALEVSNNRSVRAKRSLARTAYDRGDYEASKILWESAMALNSLYPDGWFALGAAALKARDIDKALDGFTRAIQLDPENGEAWNNIACLHMIKKKSKEACIAFKEALKFKRNNWQLWENYSQVAADVGNFGQALEAIQMVLDMTKNKRVDVDLLDKMMQEMERRTATNQSASSVAADDNNSTKQMYLADSNNESINSEFGVANSRESEHLFELLGKILQKIVRSGCGAEVWGLYARWQKIKGDLTMCSEALLKQVRAYQGADLWKDRDRFKKFAHASLELCKVYMEISSSTGSRRELLTAEMHLKNIIKQAESFSDADEYRDLQACLDDVKLQSNSLLSSQSQRLQESSGQCHSLSLSPSLLVSLPTYQANKPLSFSPSLLVSDTCLEDCLSVEEYSGEEEKAAENVYIKKIEQEKLEKLARKVPKAEEKPATSSGETTTDVKHSPPASSTSGVSTDKYRNYSVVAGVVTAFGALGWYLKGSGKKPVEVQD